MRVRRYSLMLFAAVWFVVVIAPPVWAESRFGREQKVKAAFVYNFVKFVDWPMIRAL